MDKANHDRMFLYIKLNGTNHRLLPIDPASLTRAGGTLATVSLVLPTIPMDQGDYLEFEYDVTGGAPSVGLAEDQSYLNLSALPR